MVYRRWITNTLQPITLSHPMDEAPDGDTHPTDAQVACFEAGIKFGSLYHQFAGTPVSPENSASLARAIEEAIENQPYCVDVSVTILTDRLTKDIEHGYVELTGEYMEVEVTIEYEGHFVEASMVLEEGYPRMRLDSIEA